MVVSSYHIALGPCTTSNDGTGGTWTTAIEGYIIAADKFLKDYVLTPKGRAIAEKAFKKAFGGQ
jgi:hypothetical protein